MIIILFPHTIIKFLTEILLFPHRITFKIYNISIIFLSLMKYFFPYNIYSKEIVLCINFSYGIYFMEYFVCCNGNFIIHMETILHEIDSI